MQAVSIKAENYPDIIVHFQYLPTNCQQKDSCVATLHPSPSSGLLYHMSVERAGGDG